jgi:pimeloyl-ACP methyl ester carboxylesterase
MGDDSLPESTSSPVILLLHGAWHTPEYYDALLSLLQAKGYTTSCPRMPSCNDASPPNKTLDDDVRCARQTALKYLSDGRDIVALMHSYGGVVGTNALTNLHRPQQKDGKRTGVVKKLIYMAAFIPFENQSLADMFGGQLPPWLTINAATGVIDIEDPQGHFFSDLSEDQQNKWAKALVRHPVACQYDAVKDPKLKEELGDRVAWRDVDSIVYLVCAKDQGLPQFVQEMMIDRLEGDGGLGQGAVRREVLQSSHSPFLSMPERVVELVEEVL